MINPVPLLVQAGIPADRIVALPPYRWVVTDQRGDGLVGLRYSEEMAALEGVDEFFPGSPWTVEYPNDSGRGGNTHFEASLADAVRQIVELVDNYDEAGG